MLRSKSCRPLVMWFQPISAMVGASTDGAGARQMTEVIDTLDDAADRYFLAALEEDDPDDRNLLEAFGVMELERTAILSDADLGAPAGKLAAPRGDYMLTTGNIIDLHEARLAR